MLDQELLERAERLAVVLKASGETVAVAEGSAGGLISAALLSVPGASAYYLGGIVAYTFRAVRAFASPVLDPPEGMRGATEQFAAYLAQAAAIALGSTWAIGEAGAAGPPNRYGDPAGHGWVAVATAERVVSAKHLLTGSDDRHENMVAFAAGALDLLAAAIG